jgi:hypothetical protein
LPRVSLDIQRWMIHSLLVMKMQRWILFSCSTRVLIHCVIVFDLNSWLSMVFLAFFSQFMIHECSPQFD